MNMYNKAENDWRELAREKAILAGDLLSDNRKLKNSVNYYKNLASQLEGQLKIKQMRIDELTKSND